MLEIGMQSRNLIMNQNPMDGFMKLKEAGFSCVDFSLNSYLENKSLYKGEINDFFDQDEDELKSYFKIHKEAAKTAGVKINQMHMPYPLYVPNGDAYINTYLKEVVAPKSLKICSYLECKYIVVHGFKLREYLGTEELEWKATEEFLDELAPLAKQLGVVMCLENLYTNVGMHIIEGPCCNAKKMADRIDGFNQKHGGEVLGFCFDTGHANLVGLDFCDFIETLGKRLKVLHMHDNDGVRDLHQMPYTFTRTRENKSITDWEGFVQALKTISFHGVLNFEMSPTLSAFPEDMQLDVLKFICQIGQNFASQIENNYNNNPTKS